MKLKRLRAAYLFRSNSESDKFTQDFWSNLLNTRRVKRTGHQGKIVQPPLLYFDTDAFRNFATTYQERTLPEDLRHRIVLSAITMLEVISQLAHKCGESIFDHIRGIPNWLNMANLRILPWPDEQIAHILFDRPLTDYGLAILAGQIIQRCQVGSLTEILEDAREVSDKLTGIKEIYAADFRALVDVCHNEPNYAEHFSEHWLKYRVKQYRGTRTDELLNSLSAFHEFDFGKLQIALARPNYNSWKNRNDLFDSLQLAYLCDPSLHIVTCDGGYSRKVTKSPQANRIHETKPETLSQPDSAENLLRQIIIETQEC